LIDDAGPCRMRMEARTLTSGGVAFDSNRVDCNVSLDLVELSFTGVASMWMGCSVDHPLCASVRGRKYRVNCGGSRPPFERTPRSYGIVL